MNNYAKSKRPRIEIPLQPFDYSLEALAAFGLLFLLGTAFWHYASLPDTIPVHFGPDGKPDRFGSKTTLWLLPGLGAVIYAMMTFLNQKPHWFNYSVTITPENAEKQYRLATKLFRFLKTLVLWLFACLTWGTVATATGETSGLSSWLMVIPAAIVGLTFWYLYKSFSQR
jgi:Predicted membrane protein